MFRGIFIGCAGLLVGLCTSLLFKPETFIGTNTTDIVEIEPMANELKTELAILNDQMANLTNIVLELKIAGATNLHSIRPSQDSDQSDQSNNEQIVQLQTDTALSSRQLEQFELLQESIRQAMYTGFSFSQLELQMQDLPQEYQQKLLQEVVKQVNSGQLNPETFTQDSIQLYQ